MTLETLPGKWKSVKSSACGTTSRIPSSTASPPRMPVSQSWTTATRPNDELGLLFIVHRFAFIVRRVRFDALVAHMIVREELLGRNLGQAADADVLSGPLLEFARKRFVVHGRDSKPRLRPLPSRDSGRGVLRERSYVQP